MNAPEPVPVPEPTNVIGKEDDIWGSYNAAWSKPKEGSTYESAKPAGGAWSPAPFKAFDVSSYLLKGRETKATAGTSYGGEGWWTAKPAAKTGGNWWDAWTADMPDDASTDPTQTYEAPVRKVYKPYVPRSTYS